MRQGYREHNKTQKVFDTPWKLNNTQSQRNTTKLMKKQQLVILIPADLKQWLRELAAKDDRSVSYVVAALLQKARPPTAKEPTQ